MKNFRIGVIGFGVWGCHSLERELAATGRAAITALFATKELGENCHGDHLAQELEAFASSCGARVCTSADEMLNDPEIDVISLMVAPAVKPDWLAKCIRHGKKVVTDKPLALHGSDLAICRREGDFDPDSIFVLGGYWNRPGVAAIIAAVRAGKLGQVLNISLRLNFMGGIFPGFAPTRRWRAEVPSAEMTTIGCHAILTVLKLLPELPERVFADRRNFFYPAYDAIGAEDWADILCSYASGAAAEINVARLPHRIPGEDLLLEVTGSDGYAAYRSGKAQIHTAAGAECPETPPFALGETFHALLDDWEAGRPVAVNYDDGCRLQHILDAALA